MRRVAGCLLLIVPLTLAACSDDDEGAESDDTAAVTEDPGAYCETVVEATDLVSEYIESGETPPQDVQSQFLDLWADAAAEAPAEVAAAVGAVLNDPSATDQQEIIDSFNEEECGVDTASLRTAVSGGAATTTAP